MRDTRRILTILLVVLVVLVVALLLPSLLVAPPLEITLTPSVTSTPTTVISPAAGNPTTMPSASPPVAWDVSALPTITPPGPDEPTLPPAAQAMHAAPTATPSPIPPTPTDTATPTATPTSVPATGRDDVPMVEVPAGEFAMGVTEDTAIDFFRGWYSKYPEPNSPLAPHFSDQTPLLTVNLDTFLIDQVEVTNARYRLCVAAGVCTQSVYGDNALPNYATNPDYDNYPVRVSWVDSNTYCEWVGKRLPTEAEWEKAARGSDARPYPWGTEWQPEFEGFNTAPAPVGSRPRDTSPYRVLDMAGNAPEWTADWYQPYPSNPRWLQDYAASLRVSRGSGGQGDLYFLTTLRVPRLEKDLVGFRCVRGPQPSSLDRLVMHISAYPTPVPTTQVDTSRMVYVPAGEFIMGNDNVGDDPIRQDEKPAHIVYLDGFYIDRYEVTVAEFVVFLNTLGGHKWRCGLDCIYTLDGERPSGQEVQMISGRYEPEEGYENLPVTIATWEGAQTYCQRAGKRLPTEAEWEKAARGTNGRLYPWGNDWNPAFIAGGLWSLGSNSSPFAPVGSYPDDVSPYGAYDMLGNVPEWAADWYDLEYYRHSPYSNPQGPADGTARVVRGNFGPATELGITDRRTTRGITGFRCAYTP